MNDDRVYGIMRQGRIVFRSGSRDRALRLRPRFGGTVVRETWGLWLPVETYPERGEALSCPLSARL